MKPAKGMFSKKLNVKRLQMSVESHEKIDKKQFANAKAMALEARQVERKKKAVRQAERVRIRRTEQHRRKLEQAEGDMVERAKERSQRAEERLRVKEEKKLAAKLEKENDLRVKRHTEEERLRREKKVRAELPPYLSYRVSFIIFCFQRVLDLSTFAFTFEYSPTSHTERPLNFTFAFLSPNIAEHSPKHSTRGGAGCRSRGRPRTAGGRPHQRIRSEPSGGAARRVQDLRGPDEAERSGRAGCEREPHRGPP